MTRHSLNEIEDALYRSAGNAGGAATLLGLTRQALHARIRRTPHLRAIQTAARAGLVDRAELNVIKEVFSGNFQASKYTLDRLGHEAGWARTRASILHPGPETTDHHGQDLRELTDDELAFIEGVQSRSRRGSPQSP